jgi:carboxypeptidase family protein
MVKVVLPAFQTGVVRGRFTTANNLPMPKIARLVVETPPDPKNPPEIPRNTTFECPVDDAGAWSCRVPATALDVAVVIEGFIPVYRWDLKADPARDTLLGTIQLRRGASFVAWLDSKSAKSLTGPAKARLLRGVSSDPSITAARLAAPVAEATFGKRGGVQLADIPPGVYLLEITAPGFAPSRTYPVEILDQREAVLRHPIVLEPPLTLRLTIDPPADPNGAPWSVELRRKGEFGRSTDAGPITVRRLDDAPGVFEVHDQSPGWFTIEVAGAHQQFRVTHRIEVTSELDTEQTISIPLVRAHGSVTFGGEPVAARLFFGWRDGADRIIVDANREGSFATLLPRTGTWPVDVALNGDEVTTNTEVVVADDDHEIAIDIPGIEVTGTVFDANGQRAAHADVDLMTTGKWSRSVRTRTNADGTFRFRGVRPGTATLSARDRWTSEESQHVSVPVAEGAANRVELHIESQRTLAGVVTSAGAPVIGAPVSGYALVDNWTSQVRAVSDMTGRFELRFPASTRRALIAVRAPGRVLQSFEVAVGSEPVTLDLAPVGGMVRIRYPPESSAVMLRRFGVLVPPIDLMQWAAEQGQRNGEPGSLSVPNLAPGMYEACLLANSRCEQHVLTPNSTLDLDLR